MVETGNAPFCWRAPPEQLHLLIKPNAVLELRLELVDVLQRTMYLGAVLPHLVHLLGVTWGQRLSGVPLCARVTNVV